jgi:hypothetical protein
MGKAETRDITTENIIRQEQKLHIIVSKKQAQLTSSRHANSKAFFQPAKLTTVACQGCYFTLFCIGTLLSESLDNAPAKESLQSRPVSAISCWLLKKAVTFM